MGTTTGIVLFDGAEELDFAGPWEVFTMGRQEGDSVVTIAEHDRPLTCAKGMRVLADRTFADAPALDVVLVPGGRGRKVEAKNPAMLDWLRATAPGCSWVTSVCTGAFVLEAAGLLPDARVTTHWASIPELREAAPHLEVLENTRYVRHGNVVTAAGVSAGIDMALHLVARLHSVERAREVRRGIQYDPEPPV